jgi:DMSO/TMAO reductase YedYZ molybdopterin-dependent catalytic subunit
LARSGGALLAAGATCWLESPLWAQQSLIAPPVTGKDRRMIVHVASPGELETPLELLRQHAITPKELLFVRNNQLMEDNRQTLEPAPLAGWKIEVTGLLQGEKQSLDAKELESLPQVEHVVVVQCSGNGRSFFSRAAQVKGAPWQNGAMGNVRFTGVPLAKVFEKLGVKPTDKARFLTAEGRDVATKAGGADFEHSIPLWAALDRSLLAIKMNGEPIPSVHGGPVRLVTPGYYGTMNVKWLSRLRLEQNETDNHHQAGRYRTPLEPIKPGSDFDYRLDNSDANWNMRIKSVIFNPLDGQELKAGGAEIRGVAFNDGVAKIDAVEVSLNGGRRWRRAQVERPNGPYAWHPWQIGLDLPRGEQTILARAIDALGRTQPLDGAIQWNPAGYGWSGVHKVTVRVA